MFEPTALYPSALSMGLARAEAAASVILENRLVPHERVQVASAGADRPRASNDTASGRRANRGVTVRVVAHPVSTERKLDRGGDSR